MTWWQDAYNKTYSEVGKSQEQAERKYIEAKKKETKKQQKLYKWTLKL